MPTGKLTLLLATVLALAGCTARSNAPVAADSSTRSSSTRTSVQGAPTSAQASGTKPVPLKSHRPGFMTSLGFCGPEHPFGKTVRVIQSLDGVHPTCVSLGARQHLTVQNTTSAYGSTGHTLTAALAGQAVRSIDPGSQDTYDLPGAQLLRHNKSSLHIEVRLGGVENREVVTIWRVKADGHLG